MFNYDNYILSVMGFKDILYIDEINIILLFKNKKMIIEGNNLNVKNLIDNSIEVKGKIISIKMEYFNND